MTTNTYTFNNKDDLAFYILNAVAHDFIHDFNSYSRMSKILEEIKILALASEETNTLASEETNTLATSSSGKTKKLKKSNILSGGTDTPTDEATALEEISTDEYIASQKEQFDYVYIDNNIDNLLHKLLTDAINQYNGLVSNVRQEDVPSAGTRGNLRSLYKLQKLEDFINESKLLIISLMNSWETGFCETVTDAFGKCFGSCCPKQTGGTIEVITKDIIMNSIEIIIQEIMGYDSLINYFTFIMHTYDYLSIPGVSPLEIFANDIINQCARIYIIGQCTNNNIEEQAKIILTQVILSNGGTISPADATTRFATSPATDTSIVSSKEPNIYRTATRVARGLTPVSQLTIMRGGKLTTLTDDELYKLNSLIQSGLGKGIIWNNYIKVYNGYIGNNIDIYNDYINQYIALKSYITENIIKKIAGTNVYKVKNNIILKAINKYNLIRSFNGYTMNQLEKAIQNLVDPINDLIFDKTLIEYINNINKYNASVKSSNASSTNPSNASSTDSPNLSSKEKIPVQQISKLVAKKVLELTDIESIKPNIVGSELSNSENDLNTEHEIIYKVAEGNGYLEVDNKLIEYFNNRYRRQQNFLGGKEATEKVTRDISRDDCNCRIINNAIQDPNIKQLIENNNLVVCPTSSVCDGMGSFGSCADPTGKKEYHNMDFIVTARDNTSNNYFGTTNISNDESSVAITYGFNYDKLIINVQDLVISIVSPPILLQANHAFKNVINKIVQIWKADIRTNITMKEKWKLLENSKFFLDILKVGSQKAVGDIFQEINCTLENSGYSYSRKIDEVNSKTTYGLMGDRPSGVRVIKLLKDCYSGKNNNAIGGYIGQPSDTNTSLIYVPNSELSQRRQESAIRQRGTRKKGGKINKFKRRTKKYKRNGKRKSKKRLPK